MGTLDDLSVKEVYWLIEGYLDGQKEHYEMIASAMKVAGASIMSGKDLKLFGSPEVATKNKTPISDEDKRSKREAELKYLEEQFGEF